MGLTLHQRHSGPVSDPPLDDTQLVDEPRERDPHVVPTLTSDSLSKPSSTILCPILSSLPQDLSVPLVFIGSPPLVTDTRLPDKRNPPLGDTQLVNELKERDPHVVPTLTSESLSKPSSTILCPVLSSLPQDRSVPPVSIYSSPLVTETRLPDKWNPPLVDTQLVDEPKERDPHVIPTFTSESLTKPSSTILYLPPLLSSLPRDLSVPMVPIDRPPLVTETRLPDIDPVSLSLHKALHHFRPLSDDYACIPYALAFNWLELDLPEDEEREWYAVVFRSQRKKGSDSGPLYDADRRAHEEAVSNGGLIMYWYGIPNPDTGMNLATCIWQSRKHAIAANSRPHHIRAMKLAAVSFEVYALERYRLSKEKGQKGILVEEFRGVECGW